MIGRDSRGFIFYHAFQPFRNHAVTRRDGKTQYPAMESERLSSMDHQGKRISGITIKDVLKDYKEGKISLVDAERVLKGTMLENVEHVASLDVFRELRTGIPEVIFAETKHVDLLKKIISKVLDMKESVLISRLLPVHIEMIRSSFPGKLEIRESSRVAFRMKQPRPDPVGLVGVITAGTSDIPVAEEAAIMCEMMGCKVKRVHDIGIAGIHRVFEPLRQLIDGDVDTIVCCAGMEGALPSVIASLTDVLVIGVPISTGYGHGGKGETALSSMLQSCAPGLVTVNIDNGIGAGAAAALITRKIAGKKEKNGD